MNTRNAPLSPVSVGGGSSEWSGISKYKNIDNDGPYPNNRGLMSPPDSGGPNANMNSFSPGNMSAGAPSPPPSIGRSSTYARSESGRSIIQESTENVLAEHYVALRRYLASTSKDGRANPPPNKARDKLLRLSSVQFLELSTDVFDELMRRQMKRPPPGAPPTSGPPPYLLPENTFHPKRNQARQKLSTLGSPRFRDLATDVFCELERRIPRFISGDSPPRMSGGLPSRVGTPSSGMGMPRPGRGMRRPSDASSIRSAGPPRMNGEYVPPSPGLPNGNYDRPLPKQFQSNTIVPNKSTMLEEDDDVGGSNDENDAYQASNRDSKRSAGTSGLASDVDRKLIDDYQNQVRELREKIDGMEDQMRKKNDEISNLMDGERSRATATNNERKEWDDFRVDLENKLAEAQSLNDSMRDELDRVRDDHAMESRKLREDLENAQQNSRGPGDDSDLMRENEDLRMALQEQQQVTEDARREAREFLMEMKELSQQHSPAWERQAELEKIIEQLEQEVRDWRNRYARSKTQLRSLRATSIGLSIEDAAKYVQEKGFMENNGLVKDVHVTKFQIAIDDLLRRARTDLPDKVIDSMKSVIVSVRRITKDIDESQSNDDDIAHQQQKLRNRVSATANNLITASKNFATAAGISPVSLLDAAASHLVAALVELLRIVKIRPTPAGELEEEEDGNVTPVESAAFFSNRTTTSQQQDLYAKPQESPLEPPPRFQGLQGFRDSATSSAYSPVNSPRESDQYSLRGNGQMNGIGGMAYMGLDKNPSAASNGYGLRDTRKEDLKIYLEDQTAILVQTIQGLVGSIRGDAPIQQINDEINSIADVVGRVVSEAEAAGNNDELLDRLAACRERLIESGEQGKELASRGLGENDREWRMWTQTLPPIAFEIARETKDLVQRVDRGFMSPTADDFS